MRLRPYFLPLLFLCGLLLAAAKALPAQAGEFTPEQVVRNLQKAVDKGDVALLDASADVEGVLGQAVDVFFKDIQKPEAQTSLPPALAMMLSSVASSEALRALLQREGASFVRYGVRSGHFGGQPRESEGLSGMLAPLFAEASLGRKEIRRISPMGGKDGVAVVAFEVLDHGNGQSYPVQAELRRAEGRWRITGLANMPDLLRQVREEGKK